VAAPLRKLCPFQLPCPSPAVIDILLEASNNVLPGEDVLLVSINTKKWSLRWAVGVDFL